MAQQSRNLIHSTEPRNVHPHTFFCRFWPFLPFVHHSFIDTTQINKQRRIILCTSTGTWAFVVSPTSHSVAPIVTFERKQTQAQIWIWSHNHPYSIYFFGLLVKPYIDQGTNTPGPNSIDDGAFLRETSVFIAETLDRIVSTARGIVGGPTMPWKP